MMKLAVGLIFVQFLIVFSQRVDKIHRYTALKCEVLDENIISADFCEVKSYKNLEVLNMNFQLHRKLMKIFVELVMKQKKNGEYRVLYNLPKTEFCSFMDSAMTSPLLKTLMEETQSSTNLFHKCPYSGAIIVSNFTFKDDKFFAIYPKGKYRTELKLSADGKQSIVQITIDEEVNMKFQQDG